MTSAPKSAMMVVDTGPAMKFAASITRIPSRRRVMGGSPWEDRSMNQSRSISTRWEMGGSVNPPSAQAAGDKQRFARDPRSLGRSQKDSGGRDVLRLADAAEGSLRLDLFAEVALRKTG